MAKLYSKEQIALANSVSLEDFLRMQGETLIRSGKDKRWARNKSVTVRDNTWFEWATHEGGYTIEFVKRYFNCGFKEAMEMILSTVGDVQLVEELKKQQETPKPFIVPSKNDNNKRAYAYLQKTRLIDKDVLNYFFNHGYIYEDRKYHNAVFVGFDEEGVIRHAHKRSTQAGGKSYRGNVESSDSRYPFQYKGTSATVYVFEAPIDMLSYITLHKDNWQQHSYIALNGLGTTGLEYLLEQRKDVQLIMLCFDHDEHGIEACERVTDQLMEKGYSQIGIVQSTHKDFNEDIMAMNGKEYIPAEESKKRMFLECINNNITQQIYFTNKKDVDINALNKTFAELFYNRKDAEDKPGFIREKLYTLTKQALILNHNLINEDVVNEYKPMKEIQDEMLSGYRTYNDIRPMCKRIGQVMKRMEEVNTAYKEFKTGTVGYERLSKAYTTLAVEGFTHLNYVHREELKKKIEIKQEENNVEKKYGLPDGQRPQAELIGADGNIFNLMGVASQSLKKAGFQKEAEEMIKRITTSAQSYDEALGIIQEYVEPVEVGYESHTQMEFY
ncbi:DUF3991 and toprim domain-containing protein [Thomasclavelia cocleata]|jgi:hypothetical protein|uniref:DUF3991 and toprim domain-containing protein n=1 Tax=Thomasclavelia cocleata TaxID=69824 RepID=UPI00241FBDDD|nr:DUF3991 and toprim domain-containing protein [Thomasclavelia cocleata]